MSNQKISTKKLRAIVFTDIVNFTQMSADDEQHAVDLIDKQNEILKPIVKKHNGEWLKEIGDGLLLSFDSSIEAVRCSIEIQETLKDVDELNIRIGIHQGDIILKDGDVFGDDVNIASRIESFAPVGGISMSDKVHKDISGVSDIKTSFIGHRKLKGVEQETKVRCISSHNLPKHNMNRFPIFAAYMCFFWATICFIFIVLLPILEIMTSLIHIQDPENKTPNALLEEHGWRGYIWMSIVVFVIGLTNLLIGYSTLSYSRGISIKSQRLLVYLSYLYGMLPFILLVFNKGQQQWFGDVAREGLPMVFAFFIILLVFPIAVILLFKRFWGNNN
tara:strand:- start:3 stop:998 length:996 start_codon:yes stop_codon:yes gene_type:complete